MKANTVPKSAIIVAITTRDQSRTRCLTLSCPLNNVRWNRHGRMMQIVNPANEPRSDMILSNDGTKTETMMIDMGLSLIHI